ncbi:MAG: MFS transporter permease [Desulfosarcinaceae bacterium]|nr:MFS transporter permease [Desulfosarcinaceae bacterium]
MPPALPEILIPKEKAVFRLDAQGRWHNEHGPFEHPKIIAYFNANIRRDAGGYYLSQELNGRIEKVYFPYEDTALFAVDLRDGPPEVLLLNTGARLPLNPERLATRGEDLYQLKGDERIKFAERCLLKVAERIEGGDGRYVYVDGRGRHPIAQLAATDG